MTFSKITQVVTRFAAVILFAAATPVMAADKTPPATISGAGEHFTWVLLDEIRPQLEHEHNIKLELVGRDSMVGVGCSQGIRKAKENSAGHDSFGFICCPLAKSEVEKQGLTVHPVAKEPLLILVNKSNPITDISVEQLRAIYRGEIRNWKAVGGEDRPIVLVMRPHCKDRPGHWKTIVPTFEELRKDRIDVKAEADVVQGISDFVEGIGNIGSTWIFDERHHVKTITVNHVTATAENLKNGKYLFYQEQSIVTHGKTSASLNDMIHAVQRGPAFRSLAKKYELLPVNPPL